MRTTTVLEVTWVEVGTWKPVKGLLGKVTQAFNIPEPYQFMENWHPSYVEAE
jgi:hypothetical protein